ncbi:hypothetical protein WN48_07417 [Eufriesea mexicana]|uniref:Uncharacterized protein n=1 Tax=Eufriesea mexicana TaxID=516756 RepID=A0A310SWD7_9HYME|nr:hypothetical protein WN48_07417 [Eufriesea mexicana]
MMVISALKHVANAATNAVHSATNSTGTGHGHANSEAKYDEIGFEEDGIHGFGLPRVKLDSFGLIRV